MPIEHIHTARIICDICGAFICNINNVSPGDALEMPEKQTFDGMRTFNISASRPASAHYKFEVLVRSAGPEPIYCVQCAMRVFTNARKCLDEILKDISKKTIGFIKEEEVVDEPAERIRMLELGDEETDEPTPEVSF